MCDSCPFLEKRPKSGLLCCTAGVNFYAVGQARELCRLCPLCDGGWTSTCEFMEVYTFLHGKKGQQRIEIRLDCWLPEGQATQPRCAACPAAGTPLPHRNGNGTPKVQAVARHSLREGL